MATMYISIMLVDNLHYTGLVFPSTVPSLSCSYHYMNPYWSPRYTYLIHVNTLISAAIILPISSSDYKQQLTIENKERLIEMIAERNSLAMSFACSVVLPRSDV